MLIHERARSSERLKYTKKSMQVSSVYHKYGQERFNTTFNKEQVEQKSLKGFEGKNSKNNMFFDERR